MHRSATACCATLLLFALASFPVENRAQDVFLGGQAGLSLSTFRGDTQLLSDNVNRPRFRRRASYQVGGFASVRVSRLFNLRSEVLYVQKGAVLEGSSFGISNVKGVYRFAYVQVPLLLEARLPIDAPVTPIAFLGPSVSFSVASGLEIEFPNESETRSFSPVTNTLDLGGIVGGGLRYPLDKSRMLVFDLRYNPGFSDIISSDAVELSTDTINLSVTYAFSL
ncbi:MAG: porin family protein [Candidatus Bipolaricaulia bacterium]